jgi:hypothetical protein
LSAAHEHTVQIYCEDCELVEGVASWLADGLGAGDAGVVLATAAHLRELRRLLAGRGLDVPALEAADRLILCDAGETLPLVLDRGLPAKERFERTVNPLLDRAVASGGAAVRAFGELVDILYRRGDVVAADLLEKHWNGLGARREFSLLCAYGVPDFFEPDVHVGLLPQVARTHGQVHAVGDPTRMRRAVDSALVESLGVAEAARVYEVALARQRGDAVPVPQLALMWVSMHMPRAAARVLAAAREHYHAAA